MKKIKVCNNFFDIKGMAMLEFIIVVIAVFTVVAAFIEAGYYMKAEAAVVAFARVASREVITTGGFTESSAKNYADSLNGQGVKNIKIQLFDLSQAGSTPVISYVRNQSTGGMISNEKYTNILPGYTIDTKTMGFRRNFKLIISGEHSLNAVDMTGGNFINVPVGFGVEGKIEKFKFE